VLQIQKVKGMGGSERHLLSLLPGLAARSVDVRMCVLMEGAYRRFTEPLLDKGIETTFLPAGPDANPALIARVVRLIRRVNPDLVHTHLVHADLHAQIASRVARVPAVTSVHSTHTFNRRSPYGAAARFAIRLATRTIAISQYVRRRMEEVGAARPGTVAVVPYGIDATDWVLRASERNAIRAKLGLHPAEVAVGVVSRLIANKGHDLLFDAMTRVNANGKHVKMLVAGDGPLRDSLEERARLLLPGMVRFIGYSSDVRRVMNACDCIVFPTLPPLAEGFGLAALEAMAAGRPVAASAVGSLPEVVIHGETGLLFSPGDATDLASALTLLVKDADLRHRMGAAGRARALSMFTLDQMVTATLGVYQDALGRVAPTSSDG
jgi:glycosyltransferase involved in cell wall biosynthesis